MEGSRPSVSLPQPTEEQVRRRWHEWKLNIYARIFADSFASVVRHRLSGPTSAADAAAMADEAEEIAKAGCRKLGIDGVEIA